MKMSLNSNDDQAEKPKATTPQTRANLPAKQPEASERARKEKRKKWQWKEQAKKDYKKGSPTSTANASGSNAIQATSGQKKKKTRDAFEVICYSCNKKGHYAKDYTEAKN